MSSFSLFPFSVDSTNQHNELMSNCNMNMQLEMRVWLTKRDASDQYNFELMHIDDEGVSQDIPKEIMR